MTFQGFMHEYGGVLCFFLLFWMFGIFFSMLNHWDHVKDGKTTAHRSQEAVKRARTSARWAIGSLFFGWLWFPVIILGIIAGIIALVVLALYTVGSAFSNALPVSAPKPERIATNERSSERGQLSEPDDDGGLSFPPK